MLPQVISALRLIAMTRSRGQERGAVGKFSIGLPAKTDERTAIEDIQMNCIKDDNKVIFFVDICVI
jgi:hypothetical protein